MRNMRGALWALGLAGATYAWRNKDRLQQQFNRFRPNTSPRQLPDYGVERDRIAPDPGSDLGQPRDRQFGGTDV